MYSMYSKLFLSGLLIFIVSISAVCGQDVEFSKDTVLLKEVTVQSFPLEKFAAGTKKITIDSATLSRFTSNSLSDLLQQNSPLYFKTYGNGMIATISLRGTAASHTSVMWNGVNINSMSLGQTDFSILPVFGIDKVSVHPGASSALYGSDVIGGTIQLGTHAQWTKGIKFSMLQEAGSFKHFNTAISSRYGNEKWEGRTAFFYKDLENNFPYINTTRAGNPIERQENASIQQKGFVQDLNFRVSSGSYLTLNTWWNNTHREVQPTMTVRNGDWQKDKNLKVMAKYHFNHLNGREGQARLAYFNDVLNFNGSQSNIQRIHTALEHDVVPLNNLEMKLGADWNHILADVSGYGTPISEHRNDVFLLTRYLPHRKWLLSLNVRKPFVSGFKAPLSPSLGVEFDAIERGGNSLTWKASASQNYRIPTLNDRYWERGGNKELLPEKSYNLETGVAYHYQTTVFSNVVEITSFFNDVQNWIAWIPGISYWSAHNIKRVHVKGLEINQESVWQIGHEIRYSINLSYSYSRSTTVESVNENEERKQLVYTPFHTGQASSEISFYKWFFNPSVIYTGERFTASDNSKSLPHFFMLNSFIGKNFTMNNIDVSLILRLNNIMNKVYHNYEYRAMPGRNYMMSVRLEI